MKKKIIKKSKASSRTKGKKKKPVVVAVSGGFDPIHIGHIRYMQEAKKLGDKLIVVINNDNWLEKKGKLPFMSEVDRKEIIEALGCVDKVIISYHKKGTDDMSVANEIRKIRPDIFANGGDRSPQLTDIPSAEHQVCNELGIKMVFNVGRGGKIRSSSDMLKDYSRRIKNN